MEDKKLAVAFGGIAVAFVCGAVLKMAKPVLFPFFLAIFFYFILSPVLDFLIRLKIPRAVAIGVILLSSFFLLYLLVVLFYSSGKAFAAEFPKYGQRINSFLEYAQTNLKLGRIKWDTNSLMGNLDMNRVASLLLSSLGSFFSFISNLFIVFIILIFMLAGRGKMKAKVENSFSKRRADQINLILEHIDSDVQKYLAIKTVISLMAGLLTTVVLVIFGVDFAIVFGFLAFLLNFIPNVGSIISVGLPVVIALLQFGKFWPVFWIFIIIVGLDNVIGNVLEPKLMGKGLGLSPLAVLFSLFLWYWLWGIPGMILAVPILAIFKIVASNIPSLKIVEELISK